MSAVNIHKGEQVVGFAMYDERLKSVGLTLIHLTWKFRACGGTVDSNDVLPAVRSMRISSVMH